MKAQMRDLCAKHQAGTIVEIVFMGANWSASLDEAKDCYNCRLKRAKRRWRRANRAGARR